MKLIVLATSVTVLLQTLQNADLYQHTHKNLNIRVLKLLALKQMPFFWYKQLISEALCDVAYRLHVLPLGIFWKSFA